MHSFVSRLASVLTLGLATFVAAGCATSTDEETSANEEAFTTSVTLSCSSLDQRFSSCRVDTQQGRIVSVRLARQFSTAVCVQGQSWGFDEDAVWVDRGCRASFDVTVRRGPQVTKSVSCASINGRPGSCRTEFEEITSFRLESQFSQAPCVEGQSYGLTGDTIWVNNGCRGSFSVRGFLRNPPVDPVDTGAPVTLHTFSGCDDFFTVATVTSQTDCSEIWRTVGSVKKNGVCIDLPAGTWGSDACRQYKPRPVGGAVSVYRFSGCSSLIGTAASRQECTRFSAFDNARSIRQNGLCQDIEPTDAERACLLHAP
jgi:hypothetical protein